MSWTRVLSVCLLAVILVGCTCGGANHRIYYLTDESGATVEE